MADVDHLLAQLTLGEKASLTAGEDLWSLPAIERLGIAKIMVTDGPNGARGPGLPGAENPSFCVPCGTVLGSTWNLNLIEEIGALLGESARAFGCAALLAPTVNLHRALLAGRNFECFSEDPLHTGKMAAAYIRGVQSRGVIAVIKHFVGNESEFERNSMNSEIDDRALRELYLPPFEMAVKEAGVLGLMTAYNRVNGRWVTEMSELLTDILRREWGFEGLVMTDWFGVAGTTVSATSGLDLEMPGPGRAYGPAVAEAVRTGALPADALDDMVRHTLSAFDRVGAVDTPPTFNRDLTWWDRAHAIARRAAIEGSVLLANNGILPLDPTTTKIAVIGPNADACRIMGGGSAQLTPSHRTSPLAALRKASPSSATISYERGCLYETTPRALGEPGLVAPTGFTVEVFANTEFAGTPVRTLHYTVARLLAFGPLVPEAPNPWSARLTGSVTPAETGTFTITLAQCGQTRLLLDGTVVLDGIENPPLSGGPELFGLVSQPMKAEVELRAGVPTEVTIELGAAASDFIAGFSSGFHLPSHDDDLPRAVEAAAAADVALVIVGTNEDWDSEGFNRYGFALPGGQDELVRAVAAVNANTVVVVNSGSPVDLPWVEEVAAVLQLGFGGEEMGNALADMLFGVAEPSGRLVTTVPLKVGHSPSWNNYPGENGAIRYGESIFMGYRGYDHGALPVRFPFGYGLGYTTFAMRDLRVSSPTFDGDQTLTVQIAVENTGSRSGSEVVQLYIAPPKGHLGRPPQELKAFQKVTLGPGESVAVTFELDHRSFACWNPGQADWDDITSRVPNIVSGMPGAVIAPRHPAGWLAEPGRYEVRVGRSSRHILLTTSVEINELTDS